MKVCLALLVFVICACSKQPEREMNNSSIKLDSSIVSFVKEFIKETNCQDALNEITIDKILPDSTIITIQTKSSYRRYFTEFPKRRLIVIANTPFFYYDGSEEFLENIPFDTTEISFKNAQIGDMAWTYVKSHGKVTKYKDGGGPWFYPTFYLPKPKIIFSPSK
jgi:hypothetical protein